MATEATTSPISEDEAELFRRLTSVLADAVVHEFNKRRAQERPGAAAPDKEA